MRLKLTQDLLGYYVHVMLKCKSKSHSYSCQCQETGQYYVLTLSANDMVTSLSFLWILMHFTMQHASEDSWMLLCKVKACSWQGKYSSSVHGLINCYCHHIAPTWCEHFILLRHSTFPTTWLTGPRQYWPKPVIRILHNPNDFMKNEGIQINEGSLHIPRYLNILHFKAWFMDQVVDVSKWPARRIQKLWSVMSREPLVSRSYTAVDNSLALKAMLMSWQKWDKLFDSAFNAVRRSEDLSKVAFVICMVTACESEHLSIKCTFIP